MANNNQDPESLITCLISNINKSLEIIGELKKDLEHVNNGGKPSNIKSPRQLKQGQTAKEYWIQRITTQIDYHKDLLEKERELLRKLLEKYPQYSTRPQITSTAGKPPFSARPQMQTKS